MNPLLQRFPRAVRTGGKDYPIRWDVRTCVRLVTVNEDQSLTRLERLELMLGRFYPEAVPEDLDEAVRLMVKFLNAGGEPATDGEDSAREEALPLFSYEKDGTAIYTAILQRYGIDLESETVHWWKFLAMLGDLDPKAYFSRLLQLRKGYLDGTLSREERDALLALGEAGLPPEPPVDAEEQAAMDAFLAELEAEEKKRQG